MYRTTYIIESIKTILKSFKISHIFLFKGETPGNFDIIIENDNFEKAYGTLRNFILTNFECLHSKRGESRAIFGR